MKWLRSTHRARRKESGLTEGDGLGAAERRAEERALADSHRLFGRDLWKVELEVARDAVRVGARLWGGAVSAVVVVVVVVAAAAVGDAPGGARSACRCLRRG